MTGPDCRCGDCARRLAHELLRAIAPTVGRVRVACAHERRWQHGPFVVRWGWA